MTWCSVKLQGQIYLYVFPNSVIPVFKPVSQIVFFHMRLLTKILYEFLVSSVRNNIFSGLLVLHDFVDDDVMNKSYEAGDSPVSSTHPNIL
jgi:hypothetical protein